MTRRTIAAWSCALCAAVAIAACSGGGSASPYYGTAPTATPGSSTSPTAAASHGPTSAPTVTPTPGPTHSAVATATPTAIATATPTATPTSAGLAGLNVRLTLPSGFYGNTIATSITSPRELVALPNGDLLVGSTATRGASPPVELPCSPGCTSTVYLIPSADGPSAPKSPVPFVTMQDAEAQGVAYSPMSNMIYVATTFGVWEIPYHTGDQTASATPVKIVSVRTGSISPTTDGDVHATTSVTVSGNSLYIGVGSSCNRCTETDPTRAVVLKTDLAGHNQVTVAKNFRNPIALATNPTSGAVWGGGAGQDCLEVSTGQIFPQSCGGQDNAYATNGHPYEFMDPVSISAAASSNGIADYGWPDCEENHVAYVTPSITCNNVVPKVESPAYSTVIGASFYSAGSTVPYAFPSSYNGGLFMSLHGSWHEGTNGITVAYPSVVYVPMNGDAPVHPVSWSAPAAQWTPFLGGWQDPQGNRYGRPVGLAVGPQGSLFVADDLTNAVYRIRPGTAPTGAAHVRRTIR